MDEAVKFEKTISMLSGGGIRGSLFHLLSFLQDIKTEATNITSNYVFEISFFIDLLFKLFVSKLDNGSFFEAAGDLAGICIRGYHVSLISENDRIGVEIHLSQEV